MPASGFEWEVLSGINYHGSQAVNMRLQQITGTGDFENLANGMIGWHSSENRIKAVLSNALKTVPFMEETATVTGAWTYDRGAGAAPFIVTHDREAVGNASTTVLKLSAQYLSGYAVSSDHQDPSTIPVRDAGGRIRVGTASNDYDATPLLQVNNLIAGKTATWAFVRVATTANIDLASAPSSIDGVTLNADDRVLVWQQTDQTKNGLYLFNGAGSAMTRTTDADESAEFKAGKDVFVNEGSSYPNKTFRLLDLADPFTLDTNNVVFSIVSGAGQITDGSGLIKSGDTMHVEIGTAGSPAGSSYTANRLVRTASASTLEHSVIRDDGTNVGIGVNPTSNVSLTANNASNAEVARFIRGGGTAANTAITWHGASTFFAAGIDGSANFAIKYNSLDLSTSPNFLINSSGNVGIGGTPTRKFHVFVSGGTEPTWSVAPDMLVQDNGATGGQARFSLLAGTAGISALTFSDADAEAGRLQYSHSSDSLSIYTANAERMLIGSDGQVTLGTEGATNAIINTPESFFINIDSDNTQTGKHFTIAHNATGTSGTSLFRVQDDGNVGIGTASPSVKLHTITTGDGTIAIFRRTGGTKNVGLWVTATESTGVTTLDGTGSSPAALALAVGSVEKVRVTAAGLVGIGTDSPQTTLDIQSAGASLAGLTAQLTVMNTGSQAADKGGALIFGTGNSRYCGIFGASNAGAEAGYMAFYTRAGAGNMAEVWRMTSAGVFQPATDNTYDIGSTSLRAKNVHSYLFTNPVGSLQAQLNARSGHRGLHFHGAANVYATLTNQEVGTGPVSLAVVCDIPSANPAATLRVIGLSSSSSDTHSANSLAVFLNTDGTLIYRIYGATTGDRRDKVINNFITDYGGKRIHLVVTRDGTTPTIIVDGVALVLPADTTLGTPPAWSDSITSSYLVVSTTLSGSFVGGIYRAAAFNLALTESEVRDIIANGIPFKYKWGSHVAKYTSDFSAGADSWVDGSATVVAGNIDAIGGENDTLRAYATTTNGAHYFKRASLVTKDKSYKISFRYYIPSTNTNVKKIKLVEETGGNLSGSPALQSVTDAWTEATHTFTAETTAGLGIRQYTASDADVFAGAGSVTDDLSYIKEFKVTQRGCFIDLDLENADPALSTTVQDRSDNQLNGTATSTGVTQTDRIEMLLGRDIVVKSDTFLLDSLNNKLGLGTNNPLGAIHTKGTGPRWLMEESDAAADNKIWDCLASGEQLSFRAVNDADSAQQAWLTVDRTGTTIDAINFPVGTLQAGGNSVLRGKATTITGAGPWTFQHNLGTKKLMVITRNQTTGSYGTTGFKAVDSGDVASDNHIKMYADYTLGSTVVDVYVIAFP